MSKVKEIPKKQAGRRSGPQNTRSHILQAAQLLFSENGLDKTTMRQIAAAAQVDPALIVHYFKTKQQLFVESVTPIVYGLETNALTTALSTATPDNRGERLAQAFVALISDDHTRQLLVGIVRSVSSDEHAVKILKDFIETSLAAQIETFLSGPNTKLKAELLGSQLIGLVVARYIVKVEPLASAPPAMLITYLAPRLQAHFDATA